MAVCSTMILTLRTTISSGMLAEDWALEVDKAFGKLGSGETSSRSIAVGGVSDRVIRHHVGVCIPSSAVDGVEDWVIRRHVGVLMDQVIRWGQDILMIHVIRWHFKGVRDVDDRMLQNNIVGDKGGPFLLHSSMEGPLEVLQVAGLSELNLSLFIRLDLVVEHEEGEAFFLA